MKRITSRKKYILSKPISPVSRLYNGSFEAPYPGTLRTEARDMSVGELAFDHVFWLWEKMIEGKRVLLLLLQLVPQ